MRDSFLTSLRLGMYRSPPGVESDYEGSSGELCAEKSLKALGVLEGEREGDC
jgi:hypothetical protein